MLAAKVAKKIISSDGDYSAAIKLARLLAAPVEGKDVVLGQTIPAVRYRAFVGIFAVIADSYLRT